MQLDNIVVICLALLFFGGIGYLAFKERNKGSEQENGAPVLPQADVAAAPKSSNGAKEGRKKRKRRSR